MDTRQKSYYCLPHDPSSKTQRRWLIGCSAALGGFALLGALALFAFVKLMEALTKVPLESTPLTH